MFKKLLVLTLLLITPLVFAGKAFAAYNFNLGISAQPGAQAGTVLLTWNDPDVVTNYNISYGTTPSANQYGVVGTGDGGTYVVGGLTPGQTYYFAISPVVNGVGLGYLPTVSAVAAGTTTASPKNTVSQVTVSAAPGVTASDNYGLKAVQGPGKGQVTLTWQNPYGAQQFDVIYGTQAGVYGWGAQNVGHNSNQVTISGLTSGVLYFFSVMGENGATPVGSFSAPASQYAM